MRLEPEKYDFRNDLLRPTDIFGERNRGNVYNLLKQISSGKFLMVSSVRVKKFCATTEFDAKKAHSSGFKPPYTLDEGLARTLEFEFVHPRTDDIEFVSE